MKPRYNSARPPDRQRQPERNDEDGNGRGHICRDRQQADQHLERRTAVPHESIGADGEVAGQFGRAPDYDDRCDREQQRARVKRCGLPAADHAAADANQQHGKIRDRQHHGKDWCPVEYGDLYPEPHDCTLISIGRSKAPGGMSFLACMLVMHSGLADLPFCHGQLQGDDMPLLGAPDSAQGDRGIECNKLPAVPNGKGEQIKIGKLARTVDACGIRDFRVKQADVIRPEFVIVARTGFPKAFHDGSHG